MAKEIVYQYEHYYKNIAVVSNNISHNNVHNTQ